MIIRYNIISSVCKLRSNTSDLICINSSELCEKVLGLQKYYYLVAFNVQYTTKLHDGIIFTEPTDTDARIYQSE